MIQSASTIIFMCFVYGKVEKAGTGTGPIRAWALPLPALLSSLPRPWTFTQLLSSCTNPDSERKATLMKHLAVLARPFTAAFIVASHLNVMSLNTIFISINLGGNHHSVEASLTQLLVPGLICSTWGQSRHCNVDLSVPGGASR